MQNSLVRQESKLSFSNFLTQDVVKAKINEVIGSPKDGARFMTAILSAVMNNPQLQTCEQMSVLNCAFLGEGLKLSPSPQLGQYYMVPYKNKKRNIVEATFQLGYKGYIQLAVRSGYYKKLNVLAIKEGELINYDPLNEEIEVQIIEDEVERENATTIGYYAMFEYLNGFRKAMYWSLGKMETHADKYSPAFKLSIMSQIKAGKIDKSELWKYSSFWYKDFDSMALKTMLRQLISKWGIMSIEMQQAFQADMATVDGSGNPESYPDSIDAFGKDFGDPEVTPEVQTEPVPETEKKEEKPVKETKRAEKSDGVSLKVLTRKIEECKEIQDLTDFMNIHKNTIKKLIADEYKQMQQAMDFKEDEILKTQNK